jgi:hypothetical protein
MTQMSPIGRNPEDLFQSVITLPLAPWDAVPEVKLNVTEANIISWLTRRATATRPAGVSNNCGIPESSAVNYLAAMAGRGLITEDQSSDGRLWYRINEASA